MSSSFFSEEKSKEFYSATIRGDLPLVKSLSLDPEVNLNWQDVGGRTPFCNACYNGHVDLLRYLLDFHGNQGRTIDYNLVENSGWTPFLGACSNGREKVVEMLVDDERINVNQPSGLDQTPLWFASYFGKMGITKILLASVRQIDTLKKEKDTGKSAADMAREKGARVRNEMRRKGYFDSALAIEAYEKDPQAVRAKLRRELGYDGHKAGELFALVVYLSDGYLKVPETREKNNSRRFFDLASSLPLDLQMVLCNRVFGLGDSIVKKIYSEQGFMKFAKIMNQ